MTPDFYTISDSHVERGLEIRFRCNNCASESFRATVNGMRLNLTWDQRSSLGYLFLTKGKKALIDEIKRMLRAVRPKAFNCTIGCFVKGSKEYYVLYGLEACVYDIRGKLQVYKEVKRYFRKHGWRMKASETAQLGVGYQAESVKRGYDELDPKRMLMLFFAESNKLLIPLSNSNKKGERLVS